MESPGVFLTRLLALPGYEWDLEFPPFHSSYDNWHFLGTKVNDTSDFTPPVSSSDLSHSPVPPPYAPRQASSRSSTDIRPALGSHKHSSSDVTGSMRNSAPQRSLRVAARVSRHVLRLEREYQICQQVWVKAEDHRNCFTRPIELIRIPARNGESALAIAIIEAPGANYLRDLVPFGPGAYAGVENDGHWRMVAFQTKRAEISLSLFLDFAIGATKCLEVLHHETRLVHGEIRGDAFHFNLATGHVKLVNFGSGARSFENGLTSAGWYTLSREHGIEHKLGFIAPEQTGRLPAQPDGRTDIYSLGVVLWSMLTGETPFSGDTPLVVMQNVLSRRIPQVSTKRLDVPNVLSGVIAKMTQKNIDSRYNSISGLAYDLRQIKAFLDEGDSAALNNFTIATKDISTYFNLPNHQIGRRIEHDEIVQIMQQFCSKIKYSDSMRQRMAAGLTILSSAGAASQGLADVRSEANSLSEGSNRGSTSRGTPSTGLARAVPPMESLVDKSDEGSINEPKYEASTSMNPTSTLSNSNGLARTISIRDHAMEHTIENSSTTNSNGLSSMIDIAAALLRPPGGGKQNNQHCELVAVSGSAGLGKSCMIQSIASAARLRGYFATGKFDQARKTPFDPILRILSSLFRQIFGEADVSTDFHNHIRQYVQPIWSVLHTYLDLPEWLLNNVPTGGISLQNPATATARALPKIRSHKSAATASVAHDVAADWLRAGASTKSSRFTNLLLGVLKVIASKRFVCMCIDDLHFADSESLDLLLNMERSNIPIMLIVTNREEEQLSRRAKSLISKATRIELKPFTEEETAEYVSTTMHQSVDYVSPLVAIVQEKSGGNPFFIRELLQTGYRKGCIYYSWAESGWQYDIDKVFTEFVSDSYGSQMNNDFVTRRLQELPPIAQSLLAWGSLIGNTFSFEFVKTLMEGASSEHLDDTPNGNSQDPVIGLQSIVGAFIVIATDSDDRFRFAHDRYMQASTSLADRYDKTQMHYAIAKTLLLSKFRTTSWAHQHSVHTRCRYIVLGAPLLRERVPERAYYRNILTDGAETALESGARSTAIRYLVAALDLLQDEPWDDNAPDVSYQETLRIYIRAAENHWYHNNLDEAMKLIQAVYKHARCDLDMAPCWIIESRIYVRQGSNALAFSCLKKALAHFDLPINDSSQEQCDKEFEALHEELVKVDRVKLVEQARHLKPEMEVIGLLLTELSSAGFWTSCPGFIQSTIRMVRAHLDRGPYAQCALAYLQLGVVAISRYGLTKFGSGLGDLSIALLNVYQDDSFTLGRGLTLHALFYGHLQAPMPACFPQLLQAWDASLATGDRILSLLNIGITAAFKVWASYDLAETEAFTTEMHAELTDFERDLRGGVFIIGVRQYSRALQGKTRVDSAGSIFDDDNHQSSKYEEFMRSKSRPSIPQEAIYGSYKLAALYRFGYNEAALTLAERIVTLSEVFYSSRLLYENMLYLCLAYCKSIQKDPKQPLRKERVDRIENMLRRFESASTVNDINLKAWKLLIEAEFANVKENYHESLDAYEAALDHCQGHDSALDEAMILEHYAELLMQRGARRPAYRMLHDAAAAYRSVSAAGKVNHLYNRHPIVFEKERNIGYAEASCQTDEVQVSSDALKLPPPADVGAAGEYRTNAWISPEGVSDGQVHVDLSMRSGNKDDELTNRGFSAMGLDMIDLAGILESSQILSSELKIDKLMGKMAETITEIAAADIVGIVIKDEQLEYSVSAIGTTDGVLTFEEGISMETDEVDRQLALQVTKYVLRFKETVFVHNLLEDDRFSSASATWLAANPGGKAVISLPIIHGADDLLGAIYVEGPPNKFTERNLTVLRLLVNQISISLANAFVLKKIEKVGAENAAMVGVQRKALAHARTAEGKAKDAQVEAERNMKLKEEASKAKSMFLANVSHELRTPLNGVLGMSELLKSTNLTEKQAEYADSIRICADTLLSVINDLLDFTKLDAGKMTIKKDPLDLTKVITEVVRALSFQNNQKGLETITELDIDSNLILLGDSMRLHQILMNLLSNSYKFTTKGRVTVRATPVKEEKDFIIITVTVTDTGIGIPEEQRQKLFQPFSQVESNSSRSFQGTGLGLSICKALVENLMGGQIWLESEAGQGTTVGFTIRFAKATKEELARMAEAQRQFQQQQKSASISPTASSTTSPAVRPSSIYALSGAPESQSPPPIEDGHKPDVPYYADISTIPHEEIRVCIAEDNMINQKIAISFVQRLGFECDAFENGRIAFEALGKASAAGKPYHIVLMDVQMPVLDGYDATREIRRHTDPTVRDVLIIAMTASAIQGDREKCLEAGMNDYLAKPVRPQTLKNLLESYLDPSLRGRNNSTSLSPPPQQKAAEADQRQRSKS